MNEIKLNRDQADKMIEKIDYLDSSNLIYAHKMREAVESLVECEHQYILGVCRLCGHRNDVAEPSYKKRDREYWKDVDEPDLITDAIEKEFASSKNDIEYFTNFMVGVDNNNNLVYETAEDIAGRMFEKYKNEFYKTRKTNLYFVPWLEQE